MWSMADSYIASPKKRPKSGNEQKTSRIVGPMWLGILPDLPLFHHTCPVGLTLLGKTAWNEIKSTVNKTPNKTQLTSTVDITPSKTQLVGLLTTQQNDDMSCRLVTLVRTTSTVDITPPKKQLISTVHIVVEEAKLAISNFCVFHAMSFYKPTLNCSSSCKIIYLHCECE